MLFGAGASCGSDTQTTPPLGAGLFDELCRYNPDGWGAIPDDLASCFREDFEQALPKVHPYTLGPLQRAMAAYFFQFRPRRCSLYFRLAERIRAGNWHVAFASLNYDRLLELALRGAGLCVAVGRPAELYTDVEVCLPHGCCHLFCDGLIAAPNGVYFSALNVNMNGPVIAVNDPNDHRAQISGNSIPPVMSYFEPLKRTTAAPSFISSQRARLAKLFQTASTVAVIGMKVRPYDTHIWDPLRATRARIVYCAGKEAGEEFRLWSDAAGRQCDEVLPAFWADAFDGLCSHVGIA